MKIAYLVTAYDNPAHFSRLLDAIVTPNSPAYVHIDAKSDIAPFMRSARPNVYFTRDRFPVYWGEFGLVDAEFALMRSALQAAENYDYLMLISGTDYPIRPRGDLEAFLTANAGTQFMNMVEMPNEAFGKPLWRLQRVKVPKRDPLRMTAHLARRVLTKIGLMAPLRDYKAALGARVPHGGSTWWTLSREACEYVLDFVSREKKFVKFYRDSTIPDEGMFHTIIANSQFGNRVRRNLLYTDWRAGGNHPEPINAEHVRRFIHEKPLTADDRYGPGEVFFARKFSDDASKLIEELDAHFAGRSRS